MYPFESQKVAFLQPPAAHARALSNRYARNTLAAIFACLNFEPLYVSSIQSTPSSIGKEGGSVA